MRLNYLVLVKCPGGGEWRAAAKCLRGKNEQLIERRLCQQGLISKCDLRSSAGKCKQHGCKWFLGNVCALVMKVLMVLCYIAAWLVAVDAYMVKNGLGAACLLSLIIHSVL